MARQQQLDLLSNNLANVSTDGYRQTRVSFEAVMNDATNGVADQAYVSTRHAEISHQRGAIRTTGRALDTAIDGDGFFEVMGPDDQSLYTRLGRFAVDDSGTLVLDGAAVAGEGGPISGLTQSARIERDGSVFSGDRRVGKLRVAEFENPQAMRSAGGALFTSTEEPTAGEAKLVSRSLEGSNVNAVAAMTELIRVQRAFDSAKAAIESYRQMDQRLNRDVAGR